jgi:hypothetical protein
MTVRVTCPACGCRGDVEAFLVEEEAKRMAAGFAELEPALGRAVLRYLRLFKPAKTELRVTRAATLVNELVEMISAGTVCKDERSGQRRPAPVAVWVEALEQTLSKPPLDTPLSNHHYLRAVAYGVAGEHQARGPVAPVTGPAVRKTGISPEQPVDQVGAQLEWLASQLQYKQIDQATYEKKVAELRGAQA